MVRQALGLIETVGLAAAVAAADAAVKAANVKLLGYELAKGSGLTTVKLFGDVGAVTAAVAAGKMAAAQMTSVWGAHVIPRPHGEVDKLLFTKDTVGYRQPVPVEQPPEETPVAAAKTPVCQATVPVDNDPAAVEKSQAMAGAAIPEAVQAAAETSKVPAEPATKAGLALQKQPEELCNLCGDPLCDRHKGEPRANCIHYNELKHKEES